MQFDETLEIREYWIVEMKFFIYKNESVVFVFHHTLKISRFAKKSLKIKSGVIIILSTTISSIRFLQLFNSSLKSSPRKNSQKFVQLSLHLIF